MTRHQHQWPLVGRDALLDAVLEHLDSGTAMVLSGDAGVGKTRLAREVLVDDAQHLDDASQALIDRLLTTTDARVLLTVRSDAETTTGLWKDQLARRLEVTPLDRASQDQVVTEALGATPDGPLSERLWQLAVGRPLYLRELIHAGLSSGAIGVQGDRATLAEKLQPADGCRRSPTTGSPASPPPTVGPSRRSPSPSRSVPPSPTPPGWQRRPSPTWRTR